jgi:hypothetical protein
MNPIEALHKHLSDKYGKYPISILLFHISNRIEISAEWRATQTFKNRQKAGYITIDEHIIDYTRPIYDLIPIKAQPIPNPPAGMDRYGRTIMQILWTDPDMLPKLEDFIQQMITIYDNS